MSGPVHITAEEIARHVAAYRMVIERKGAAHAAAGGDHNPQRVALFAAVLPAVERARCETVARGDSAGDHVDAVVGLIAHLLGNLALATVADPPGSVSQRLEQLKRLTREAHDEARVLAHGDPIFMPIAAEPGGHA